MAESIFDLIYGTDRFKKPQTGLMSSFDDTDYGDLTAQPEKDYLQGMKTRDKIALLTSPYPVVGGITGTYADAMNMIENPEERTLANAGLMALNFVPSGRTVRNVVEKARGVEVDPRYSPERTSKAEQERLNNVQTETEANTLIQPEEVSIADLEGRPFFTDMADRTEAGKTLTRINDVTLDEGVRLKGGQNYMMDKENIKHGNLWASATGQVSNMNKIARQLKEKTGKDPLFIPYAMSPSSVDFSKNVLETMLHYNDTVLPRRVLNDMDKAIKKIDPDWVGIKNKDKVSEYIKNLDSDKKKKAILQMLDKDFRNKGGLSVSEARVSVSEVDQLTGVPPLQVRNVGLVDPTDGRFYPNHHTYDNALKGEPVGKVKEKFGVLDLLDDSELRASAKTEIPDRRNPSGKKFNEFMFGLKFGDKRSGIITEEKLRNLEKLGLLDTATK